METHKLSTSGVGTCQYQFHILPRRIWLDVISESRTTIFFLCWGSEEAECRGGDLTFYAWWVKCAKKPGEGKSYWLMGENLDTLTLTVYDNSLCLISHTCSLRLLFLLIKWLSNSSLFAHCLIILLTKRLYQPLIWLLLAAISIILCRPVKQLKHIQILWSMSPFNLYANS